MRPLKEDKSTDIFILPATIEKERKETAIVAEVGPDVQNKNLKLGTKVLFIKYGATPVELDKKELLVIGEEDILAILEEK